MKPADMFPTACKFKTLFCSTGNKKWLQALLKAQLSELSKSTSQELVYSVGEDCMSLSSGDIQDSLRFSQGEADTIMLSVYAVLKSSGYTDPVVIMQKTQTCTFRLKEAVFFSAEACALKT